MAPQVELTPEQKALYPELTQLQEQLRSVQDAELKLRQHIVYQVKQKIQKATNFQ